MVTLGSQIKGTVLCIMLYGLGFIVVYRPSYPLYGSTSSRPRGLHTRLKKEFLLPRAREEGMTAGYRGGGLSPVAKDKVPPEDAKCRAMFSLQKEGKLWVDDDHYTKLSHQLAPLIISGSRGANSVSASVTSSTRLQVLNGSVPYLPCKIREFSANDLGSCIASRSAQGRRTWIAFVGDSNGRQKLQTLLYTLPPDFKYSFFLGSEEVSFETFLVAVALHEHHIRTFDIVGHRKRPKKGQHVGENDPTPRDPLPPFPSKDQDVFSFFDNSKFSKPGLNYSNFPLNESSVPKDYDFRVTLVWAAFGSEANVPWDELGAKVEKLREWVEVDATPDVIVVGFGKWILQTRKEIDELASFTMVELLSRPLVEPLTQLAKKTTILFWHQSRFRFFKFNYKLDLNLKKRSFEWYWDEKLHTGVFSDSIPFMDAWMWTTSFRDTGMWHWDSTVPFNLANIRECHILKQAGLSNHMMYKGKWWNCADIHHSSFETNFVELQMLFNFLCNPFVTTGVPYCCSQT